MDILLSSPDPGKRLIEETMGALDQIVRSGKAAPTSASRYTPEQRSTLSAVLREVTPMIHQENYSMLNRKIEAGLTDADARGQSG